MTFRRAGVWVLVLLAWPWTAVAQEPAQEPATRDEALRQEREAKNEALEAVEPGTIEKALIALENDRILERFTNPAEGFYPKMDNVTTGSATALGPAYRYTGMFGGTADLTTFALWSLDRYWAIDARLAMPRFADGRVTAELMARLYSYPSEEFFGIGPLSSRIDHVTYSQEDFEFGGRTAVSPLPWLTFGGSLAHVSPEIGPGRELTPIANRFDDVAAPGLREQPSYLKSSVSVDLNYREPRGNPRKGGKYMATLWHYDDRNLDRFGFTRFEVDLQQYINLYKERRVLALHALTSFSNGVAGQTVPFYLQKTLGGPDDLRGFRRFRFRDDDMLLLQAEYRWEIFTAVDGAIFYDAGMVAPEAKELSIHELESDYGIGFRFGNVNGVFLRVEGAFGSNDGAHFIFRFAHVF